MDALFYDTQIKRLQDQWPTHYKSERVAAFWKMFRDVPDNLFEEAVSQLLVSAKFAPLANELSKEIELAKQRQFQTSSYGMGRFGPIGVMLEAQSKTHSDREFVKRCVDVVSKRTTGRMTAREFNEACNVLDEAAKLFCKR